MPLDPPILLTEAQADLSARRTLLTIQKDQLHDQEYEGRLKEIEYAEDLLSRIRFSPYDERGRFVS